MEKGAALVIAAVLLCIASVSAQEIGGATAKALYYEKPYTPTSCFGNMSVGVLVASVSNDLWENSKACGRVYTVWCLSASSDELEPACLGQPQSNDGVVVSVVDNCEKCDSETIILSEEAFESIARKEAGSIQVVYTA